MNKVSNKAWKRSPTKKTHQRQSKQNAHQTKCNGTPMNNKHNAMEENNFEAMS
jgi:hypothetical protein